MKIIYYPGCSLRSTGRAYDLSVKAVCQALGVELLEPDGWVCCGSSPAYKLDRLLSLSLSAQNLNLAARERGDAQTEMITPCPYCFRRLKSAQVEIASSPDLQKEVEAALGEPYSGQVVVRNMLDFLANQIGLEAIRARVMRPLHGLQLVPYYGCALTRPPGLTGFDHPENPQSMDRLLRALGADVLDWNFKTECCGAGLSVNRPDVVVRLGRRILNQAHLAGAQAIALPCQLCQANLDLRQPAMLPADERMPVLFFTQLMGLAFDLPAEALGLRHHVVDPRPLLEHSLPHPAQSSPAGAPA